MANDIKILWDDILGEGDIEYDNGDLTIDNGLETAVIVSLFTDRRVTKEETLPDPNSEDRRGWWGDQVADIQGDEIGSKLWLLERSSTTQDVIIDAEIYINDALQWMIDDGVVLSYDVEVERQERLDKSSTLGFKVIFHQTDGADKVLKFNDLWLNQIGG
jgi:phage gp46-like protein